MDLSWYKVGFRGRVVVVVVVGNEHLCVGFRLGGYQSILRSGVLRWLFLVLHIQS